MLLEQDCHRKLNSVVCNVSYLRQQCEGDPASRYVIAVPRPSDNWAKTILMPDLSLVISYGPLNQSEHHEGCDLSNSINQVPEISTFKQMSKGI
jgi:hypothetical protein